MPKQPIEPSMSKLDEILNAVHQRGVYDANGWTPSNPEYWLDSDVAKQAILQWVNDEVVGKNSRGETPKLVHQSQLRSEQRNILKQHGWKGDGNVQ